MAKYKQTIQDGLLTVFILVICYLLNYILQFVFETDTVVPTIFVLGVFFIALKTEGYLWGVVASLASVMVVNFTFTAPYFEIDLIKPENILAAVVMLVVAIMTSTLTTQIKEQEKIKAESEKERMRGNLLRAVSHDLRTPLTSIYGSTSAIMENYDSISKEQQLKLLGEIHEDSQWLIRMVENLLSVTRIDDGVAYVTKTSTVLEELIDIVLVKFHKHYPKQEVMVEIPEDFISIPMDAMLIEQVLINILENAIIHAEGMTELKLSVTIEGEQAIFRVEDNGCGIPEEKLGKLFSGYLEREQTPADGTRNNMGIGLSVCSTIIKAHGGEVFAANRENGGAVFGFSLELEEENE